LHSKRANIFYLEHCRVMQKDDRVLYLTQGKKEDSFWNIPIANTTVILLGSGTSITQAAVRMLAAAGVLIGFCGGGGTPLFAGAEIEWLTPQSEYRPTEFLQGWMKFWFDEKKQFQLSRISFLRKVFSKDRELIECNIDSRLPEFSDLLLNAEQKIMQAGEVANLLQIEGQVTRQLYKNVSVATGYGHFVRKSDKFDDANVFLNHGNYLAYGLAATTLWVLGIPHSFAVMHGKTRRGALVFDVADLIKDALVLPWAFVCAQRQYDDSAFRQQCIDTFTRYKAMDFMFDQVKQAAQKNDWLD